MPVTCDVRCPDYDGLSLEGIHVRHDNAGWVLTVEKGGNNVAVADFYDPVMNTNPSAVTRTHYELTITPTSVQFGEPAQNAFVKVNVGPGFTKGLIQWSEHSYDPQKTDPPAPPATWHWDNFSVNPAIPMPMIHTDLGGGHWVGYADGTVKTVTFNSAAPAGSYLAFDGTCAQQLDFGSGFTTAPKVLGDDPRGPESGHAYFVPVPAGATSVKVKFAGDGWYNGLSWPCLFEDPVLYHVG
jgi:hypothetical protein